MTDLVPPHGGTLLPRLVPKEERATMLMETASLRKVKLSSREISDLIMLGIGAYSPLEGFLCSEDYESVVVHMRLKNALLWPVPITLTVSAEEAETIEEGSRIALINPDNNEIMASMLVREKYLYDKRTEALQVFKTDDAKHPGVANLFKQGEVYLGGPVGVISEGEYAKKYPEYAHPTETRRLFKDKGWITIAAFQTRNPIHRSHEYLTKIALEICDGLLIHPIIGLLKEGDIPTEVRMECYRTIINNYYPEDRVLLKVYPMQMRYGGPREAVLHAIIRQNFGCSHFIIGRDHAGVGDFYAPFEAQDVLKKLCSTDLYIKPLCFDNTFWCYKCDSMASSKTCPHGEADHLSISGTKLREMLSSGKRPSEKFSRKEITDILIKYYKEKA